MQPGYGPTNIDHARVLFSRRHPGFDHSAVAKLRDEEYARLDAKKQVYLDYTGGGLHGASQIRKHTTLLANEVLGNPHSHNPTSLAMTRLVDDARAYVLRYFRSDPDEYIAVFTPNASGALKHVGESYPFDESSRFVIAYDNHNSVNGIREFAACKRRVYWLRADYTAGTAAR